MSQPLRSGFTLLWIIAALLLFVVSPAVAQVSEVHYSSSNVQYAWRLSAGSLEGAGTAKIQGAGVPEPVYDTRYLANVVNLELDNVSIDGNGTDFSFRLNCKGHSNCASMTHSYDVPRDPAMSYRGKMDQVDSVDISCNSRSECQNFLDALKASRRPAAPPPSETRTAQPQPTPASATPSSTPSRPADDARAPDSATKDISDSIGWKNGSTKKLDELAKKKPVAPKEPERPWRPTYAAFAQSAGFDANSGWGAGTSTDLNSAIGAANVSCVNRSGTLCGDEGYCMLRPGMYGAWASDLKYLGAKGSACNYKSLDEAEAQALAWCGSTACQILWSGGAQ
jgi:hypothetical protein